MGLLQCPDCDEWVSDHATVCPHCGCPFQAPPSSPWRREFDSLHSLAKGCLIVFLIVLVGTIIATLLGYGH